MEPAQREERMAELKAMYRVTSCFLICALRATEEWEELLEDEEECARRGVLVDTIVRLDGEYGRFGEGRRPRCNLLFGH